MKKTYDLLEKCISRQSRLQDFIASLSKQKAMWNVLGENILRPEVYYQTYESATKTFETIAATVESSNLMERRIY